MQSWLLGFLFATAASAGPRFKGEVSFSSQSRHHRILYDVQQSVESESIIDIGNLTGMGAVNTSCDLDSSRIVLTFARADSAQAFLKYVHKIRNTSGFNVFFTASGRQGCALLKNSKEGFLFRRVLSDAQTFEDSTTAVVVRTAAASYSDVYSLANVSYTSRPEVGGAAGWKMCIGVNADPKTCDRAQAPITLYNSDVVSVVCDDCFAGFKGEVFFDLEISGARLRRLSGGLRNMIIHAGMGLDMQAKADKPVLSVSKNLFQSGGADQPVLSFMIGPIPFAIWFQTTIDIHGDLSFSAQARAKVHLAATYDIGDSYLQWHEGRGWSRVKPQPELTITPSVEGSANFGVTGSISMPSSISIHVNQVFSHSLDLTPKAGFTMLGDTKGNICLDAGFSADLVSTGKLELSIPMTRVRLDATYGPETLWSIEKQLPKKCAKLSATTALIV